MGVPPWLEQFMKPWFATDGSPSGPWITQVLGATRTAACSRTSSAPTAACSQRRKEAADGLSYRAAAWPIALMPRWGLEEWAARPWKTISHRTTPFVATTTRIQGQFEVMVEAFSNLAGGLIIAIIAAMAAASALPGATITDVTSVKAQPLTAALAGGADASRLVGGHPMAGRETSGAASARHDLFDDRVWVIAPVAQSDPSHIEAVRDLAVTCGAVPVVMSPEEHDRAVALTSHAPQVLSSLLVPRRRVRLDARGNR